MAPQGIGPYIATMTFADIWNGIAALIREIPQSSLLIFTVAALVGSWLGAVMVRRRVASGRLISAVSTLMLGGVLVLVVLQMSRFDPRLDVSMPELGLPEQVVAGGETRIPMARDGHFWLEAEVNGTAGAFMVDTGATLTSLSPDMATRAGLEPRDGGMPVILKTANGSVAAKLTTIETLAFGSIDARGLDAVIVPGLEGTNVIGMNLLSRLGSWRVEQNTMILVPNSADRAGSADISVQQ